MSNVKTLEQPQNHTANNEAGHDQNTVAIKMFNEVNVSESSFLESVETKSSQVSSDARMSAGRFAGSHVFRISDSHSFNLVGMDSAGVVATRSGSSPGIDSSRTITGFNNEIHGVPSFDRFNVAPTNSEALERVSDDQTFIKESNLWSNEEQSCCGTYQGAPEDCCQGVMKISLSERGSGQTNTEKIQAECEYEIAPGAKDLGVIHLGSFSRNDEGSAR